MAALTPLNAIVLDPWVGPSPVSLIWTGVPPGPLVGEKLATTGLGMANTTFSLLVRVLTMEFGVTVTGPLRAPEGTVATICVLVQLMMLLAVTILEERAPDLDVAGVKFVSVIAIEVATT